MLSNNGLCYAACAVHVTIFSIGSKVQLVSEFMELHILTQATHSYALLTHRSNGPVTIDLEFMNKLGGL